MKVGLAIGIVMLAFLLGIALRGATHDTKKEAKRSFQKIHETSGRRLKEPHHEVRKALALEDRTRRWLAWIAKAEAASLDEFGDLVKLVGDDEHALQIIIDEWLRRDPRHLLEFLSEGNRWRRSPPLPGQWHLSSISFYLIKCIERDLEYFLPHFSGLKSTGEIPFLQKSALLQLALKDPTRVLQYAREWKVGMSSIPMSDIFFDPRSNAGIFFEELLLYRKLPFAITSQEGLRIWRLNLKLFGNWQGQNNPREALAVESHSRSKEKWTFRHAVFDSWLDHDADAATAWLAEQEEGELHYGLQSRWISNLAKKDPQTAYAWCRENLEGGAYEENLFGVMEGALEHSHRSAFELFEQLEPGRIRRVPAMAIARKLWPDPFSDDDQIKQFRNEALPWLYSIENTKVLEGVLRVVDENWAETDPQSMVDFFSSEQSAGIRSKYYDALATKLAEKNPVNAMEWAESFEGGKGDQISRRVFETWRKRNEGEALQWFGQLPADSGRRKAIVRQTALELIRGEPRQDFLRRFSESERERVRERIKVSDMREDYRQQLLELIPK